MIIQPLIKMNVAFNAHPLGIKQYIENQTNELKQLPNFAGPKTALVIGGSTGYGLATRLMLGLNANTNIINLSYENEPTANRTGSAGFWNNVFAAQVLKEAGIQTKDFLGDAFADETRARIATYIKDTYGKIDLLVYSLASGRRKDPKTSVTYTSALKSIGESLSGYYFDIKTKTLSEKTIEPASADEIDNTVKVMGGEDWQLWIEFLLEHDLLAENFQTTAYSYIGPEMTKGIYRDGTIGKAKEHIEATAHQLDQLLQASVSGHASTSVCKAVITRASAVIPIVPMYGAALLQVMSDMGLEELPHIHIHRLFHDMLYGNAPVLDEAGRYRPDAWELRDDVQKAVTELVAQVTPENANDLLPTDTFVQLFLEQNGFGFPEIDYDADVDIESLMKLVDIEVI